MSQTTWFREDTISIFSFFSKLLNSATYLLFFVAAVIFSLFFISFFQSSSILRLNQELMSSRASLRTAGNSRKSWEENDKWDHQSIIQSPFHSYIMMRTSELTWSFVCLIFCLSELFVFWSGPGGRLQGRAWWSCLPQGCAWSPGYWQGTGGGWTIPTSYN